MRTLFFCFSLILIFLPTNLNASDVWYVVHGESGETANGIYRYRDGEKDFMIPSFPLPKEGQTLVCENECTIRTFPHSQISVSPQGDKIAFIGVGEKLGEYVVLTMEIKEDGEQMLKSCKTIWKTSAFNKSYVEYSSFLEELKSADLTYDLLTALSEITSTELHSWGYQPTAFAQYNPENFGRFAQIKMSWNRLGSGRSLFIRVRGIEPGEELELFEHSKAQWANGEFSPQWDFTNEFETNSKSFELKIDGPLEVENLQQTVIPGETYALPPKYSQDRNSIINRWLSLSPDGKMVAIWQETKPEEGFGTKQFSEALRVQLVQSTAPPKIIYLNEKTKREDRMKGKRRIVLWENPPSDKKYSVSYIVRLLDTQGHFRKIVIPNSPELDDFYSAKVEGEGIIQDVNSIEYDLIGPRILPRGWQPKIYVAINETEDWEEFIKNRNKLDDKVFFFGQSLPSMGDEIQFVENEHFYYEPGAIFKPRMDSATGTVFGMTIRPLNDQLPDLNVGGQNWKAMHAFRNRANVNAYVVELRSIKLNPGKPSEYKLIDRYVTDFSVSRHPEEEARSASDEGSE